MPTVLPHPRALRARLSARQVARLLWLNACSAYLLRRLVRLTKRQPAGGSARSDGRLLHFARRWVAREEEIAAILQEPVPDDVLQVRAIFCR